MYIESEDMHLLASADSHELACHVGTRVILDSLSVARTHALRSLSVPGASPHVYALTLTYALTHTPHALSSC